MKKLTILGLGGLTGLAALMLAGQAFATPVAPVPGATACSFTAPGTGYTTYGSPVCIAPQGTDAQGTGLQSILAGPTGPYSAAHNQYSVITSGPGVNVYADQTLSSLWTITGSGGSVSNIVLQIAGNAGLDTFGIYAPGNTAATVSLFTPGALAGASVTLNRTFNSITGMYSYSVNGGPAVSWDSPDFGYFLTTPNNTFYSDPSLNQDPGSASAYPGGVPHQVAYVGDNVSTLTYGPPTAQISGIFGTNEYIMAWEDLPFASSDLDYNDFIVLVESVLPVPEPAVLGMFGFGVLLIGLFVGLRRRSQD